MSHQVMTALGPVSTEALGMTSMHEHLVVGMPGWEYDATYTYDRKEALKICTEQVLAAKEFGLRTFVDATPTDLARDPEMMKAIQGETGVNVLCAAGLYTEAEGNSAFWRILSTYQGYDEALKRLTDSYIHDITVGIQGTDVKCALLKLSAGKGSISKLEELSIHAGVLAHRETGAPIISHTGSADVGPVLAEMLLERGADPKKTMIGHMCDTDDLDCLERTLKQGVYVGLDRFGLSMIFSDERKCQMLCKLVELGYEDRILLGSDRTIYNHAGDPIPEDVMATMPDWNMSGLFRTFLPRCRELGLTEAQVRKLLVDNPKRFFEGA